MNLWILAAALALAIITVTVGLLPWHWRRLRRNETPQTSYSAIGIWLLDPSHLQVWVERTLQEGKGWRPEGAWRSIKRLTTPEGVELWATLNETRKRVDEFDPYFRGGDETCTLHDSELLPPWPDGRMTNLVRGWIKDGDLKFPVIFACVNAVGDEVKGEIRVRLAALGGSVRTCASAADCAPLALPSFLPLGSGERKSPIAAFTGTVLECRELKNSWTGDPFIHVILETLGMKLDLALDRRAMHDLPRPGQILLVDQARLSGTVEPLPAALSSGS